MSGASREHNLVAGNLFRDIGNQLRGSPLRNLYERHEGLD